MPTTQKNCEIQLTGVQRHLSARLRAENLRNVLQRLLADSRRRQLHRVRTVKEARPRRVEPIAVVDRRLFLRVRIRILKHLAITLQLGLTQDRLQWRNPVMLKCKGHCRFKQGSWTVLQPEIR